MGINCRKAFWDLLGSNFGAPGEKFVFSKDRSSLFKKDCYQITPLFRRLLP